jgi:NAD-reducing hydrogenase small subunit
MTRIRFATTWLDGCSGCHMSFLDLDERLIELGGHIDLVYSPLVDFKDFPPDVDVCLVEGAVSSEDDLHKVRMVRERTRVLIAFGDCHDNATVNQQIPEEVVPRLLPKVLPVHHVVDVDCFLPGCPPSAELIWQALGELVDGKIPDPARLARFGK